MACGSSHFSAENYSIVSVQGDFSFKVWGNVPSKLDDFPRRTGSSWEGPVLFRNQEKASHRLFCNTGACTYRFCPFFSSQELHEKRRSGNDKFRFPQPAWPVWPTGRPLLSGFSDSRPGAFQTLRGSLHLPGEELAGAGSHAGTPSLCGLWPKADSAVSELGVFPKVAPISEAEAENSGRKTISALPGLAGSSEPWAPSGLITTAPAPGGSQSGALLRGETHPAMPHVLCRNKDRSPEALRSFQSPPPG